MNPFADMSRDELLRALEMFTNFARTVDNRIRTRCLHCPPGTPEGKYCGWEFTLGDDVAQEDPGQ